ncbi:MAG: cytochrome b/b6 domain-containing protein [Gammaproteobacteria bacterium]
MTDELPAGRQSRQATILGWILFIAFAVLFWNIITMPRTALDQRAFLHAMHYSVGTLVFVLAVLKVSWWLKKPVARPPTALPPASFAFNRAILLALMLVFVAEGIMGYAYAWGTGHDVTLFGIPVPALLPKSEPTRMSMGYFHSALGFYYMMLASIWLAFGIYQHLRYKVGLKRLWPGARV